jgi:hypothetical protein
VAAQVAQNAPENISDFVRRSDISAAFPPGWKRARNAGRIGCQRLKTGPGEQSLTIVGIGGAAQVVHASKQYVFNWHGSGWNRGKAASLP